VTGRIEELRRLEAAERGLERAVRDYARASGGEGELFALAERHRQMAELLATRLHELGGETVVEPDDQWIIGPTDRFDTILFAEHSAQRTYHDHLLDLDPETLRLVRDRILPAHEQTLAQLEQQA
jgi:hypothetical protein